MNPDVLTAQLTQAREFFDRGTSCLDEADSQFAPTPEMFTVAQQVAHVAMTVDWFLDGAFSPEGFDMDFEAHVAALGKVTSLEAARAQLDASMSRAASVLESKSAADLAEAFPPDSLLAGAPRSSIVGGIIDHTAHHRGALSVYARLRGKVPAMPYM